MRECKQNRGKAWRRMTLCSTSQSVSRKDVLERIWVWGATKLPLIGSPWWHGNHSRGHVTLDDFMDLWTLEMAHIDRYFWDVDFLWFLHFGGWKALMSPSFSCVLVAPWALPTGMVWGTPVSLESAAPGTRTKDWLRHWWFNHLKFSR